jgi:hypothetical protein
VRYDILSRTATKKVVVVLIKKMWIGFRGEMTRKTDYRTIRITVFLKSVVIDRQPDNK